MRALFRSLVLCVCLCTGALALSACSSLEPPVPVGTQTPQPTTFASPTIELVIPTQSPSATPEPLQPTPTPTPEPTRITLEPQVIAAAIRIADWSPDGDWLAYWASTTEQVTGDFYPFPPGRLVFLNTRTQQTCDYPDFIAVNETDGLDWQSNGEARILLSGKNYQGFPCQGEFAPMAASATPEAGPSSALSPGGAYRAETTVQSSSAGILNLRTDLLALPDQQVINSVDWKIDERLGEVGLGGQWLAGNQFLIYETLDQGPLLATVGGEVQPVASDLFGIDHLPSLLGSEGYNLRAAGSGVAGSDQYHVALYGVGSEASFPPVRLYHSEDGAVEEMPFRHLWSPAFSPDGRWLLLDERSIQDETERRALWVRPVDPQGSPVRHFADGETSAWTAAWDRAAFGQGEKTSAYSFPAGEPLGVWTTGAYPALEFAWSPDGRKLAVLGSVPGEWRQALFFVEMP